MSKTDYINTTLQDDGLAFISLNRPPVNALSADFILKLSAVIKSLKAEPKLRCLLITSRAKHFCAGADLKERQNMSEDETREMVKQSQSCFNDLAEIEAPVIVALNGAVLGGGAELALASDFRVAGESALIGFPETSLGIIPGAGGTQRLARIIGISKAKYWLFSARKFSADEAWQDGFVDFISADDEILETAIDLAHEILANAPTSLKAVKSAIDNGMNVSLKEGLEIESKEYNKTLSSQERKDALKAFSKRK